MKANRVKREQELGGNLEACSVIQSSFSLMELL